MKTRAELKNSALKLLTGNWTNPVLFTLVFLVVIGTLTRIPFIGQVIGILAAASIIITFLAFFRWEKKDFKDLIEESISPYKEDYLRWGWSVLLMGLYVVLWSLLLVIPGIIKSYSYALVPYLLKDNKKLEYNDVITKSRKLMDGHKFDLFVLDLSFLGWAILACLTFGIGFLWFVPYLQTTRAAFYEDLMKNVK